MKRWAKDFDCCIDCKRSDRPHWARGFCHPCYQKYRYANDPVYRERAKLQSKRSKILHWDKYEEARKRRQATQTEKILQSIRSKRYSDKVSPWKVGMTVWYQPTKGRWVQAKLIDKYRGRFQILWGESEIWSTYHNVKRQAPDQKPKRTDGDRVVLQWRKGTEVWYEIIPGRWIKGTICSTKTKSAVVKFAVVKQRLPFSKLRKEPPCRVMEAA